MKRDNLKMKGKSQAKVCKWGKLNLKHKKLILTLEMAST